MSNETDWISLELIERDRLRECRKSTASTVVLIEERKKKQGYYTNLCYDEKDAL